MHYVTAMALDAKDRMFVACRCDAVFASLGAYRKHIAEIEPQDYDVAFGEEFA